MDKPPQLPPGTMQLDFTSVFYAGKPQMAATAAALSRALGPPRTPARVQLTPLKVQSSVPLWPPVLWPSATTRKHPMPLPTQPPAKKLQMRRSSAVLPQALPMLKALPVAKLPLAHVQVQHPKVSPVDKTELPKMEVPVLLPMPATSVGMSRVLNSQMRRNETSSDSKDGAPTNRKNCNCKQSRCLKMYCECFASGGYCYNCNCTNCSNNVRHENARRDAITAVIERNPVAFRPKIRNIPTAALKYVMMRILPTLTMGIQNQSQELMPDNYNTRYNEGATIQMHEAQRKAMDRTSEAHVP